MCGASTNTQLVGVTDEKIRFQNVLFIQSPMSLYSSPVKVKFVFDWFYNF